MATVPGGTGLALRIKNHGDCGCFGRADLPFAATAAAVVARSLAVAAFERPTSETSSMLVYGSIAVLLTSVLYLNVLGNLLIKGP